MSDPRLSVLFDLLGELAAEGRQGIAEALDTRPELWLQVPTQAAVALPWRETGFGWARYDVSRVKVLEVESTEDGWKVLLDGVYLCSPVEGQLRKVRVFKTREEAQATADAALLAAGWRLL